MISQSRARHIALIADLNEKNARLKALKEARITPTIAGTTIEASAAITSLEGEIIALAEAIEVVDRQATAEERNAVNQSRAEALRCQVKRLDVLQGRYGEELRRVQSLLEEVIASLQQIDAITGEIAGIANPHSAESMGVTAVQQQNVHFRMSNRIQNSLAKLGVSGYGTIQWPPRHPVNGDWADEDCPLLSRSLAQARNTMLQKAEDLDPIAGE